MAYRDPFVLPATPEQKTRAQKIKQVRRTHGGGGGGILFFWAVLHAKPIQQRAFGPCF